MRFNIIINFMEHSSIITHQTPHYEFFTTIKEFTILFILDLLD